MSWLKRFTNWWQERRKKAMAEKSRAYWKMAKDRAGQERAKEDAEEDRRAKIKA